MTSNEDEVCKESDVMTAEAYRNEKYACDAWIDAAATMLCRYCEQTTNDANGICDECLDAIMRQVLDTGESTVSPTQKGSNTDEKKLRHDARGQVM